MKRLLMCMPILCASLANAQNMQVQNLTVTGTTNLATPPAVSQDCSNILAYGGSANGITDNSTAFANAIAASSSGHACIYFPPGKYMFLSQINYSLPSPEASITIIGSGQDITDLVWPNNNGGIVINYSGAFNSSHIRNMAILTGVGGGGSGIYLNQTAAAIPNPANSAPSDISSVTLRGADGYAASDYWTNAINVNGISNINFINDFIASATNGSYSSAGQGVMITGNANVIPVVFNFSNTTMNYVGSGIVYGNYVQGVTVSQCNFTGGTNGIISSSGETGLSQLSVSGSQFNVKSVAIAMQSNTPGTLISNNVFILTGNGIGILLAQTGVYSISGNSFGALGSNTNGVVIVSGSNPGIITGNAFQNLTTAVWLQSSSNNVNVQSNAYIGNTNKVLDSGTNNSLGMGSL